MEIAAYHMTTEKQWAEIVLADSTLKQLATLKEWLTHQRTEITENNRRTKTGFRTLFYGPSGTGKSLTAVLLGNEFNVPVYRVDLSMMVSKYIGETEKNLDLLFSRAENKRWVLFFDEADALFGKRTDVKDSHDRYANIEISYLLQRMEEHNGLVILATNRRSAIDEAFLRRFQLLIEFPLPDSIQRKKIWQLGLAGSMFAEERIDLESVATQYELSPSSIVRVAHALNDSVLAKSSAAATHDLLLREIEHEQERQLKK